jgi:hypothetical protein
MKGRTGELTLNIQLTWIQHPHGIRNVDDVTAIERSRGIRLLLMMHMLGIFDISSLNTVEAVS